MFVILSPFFIEIYRIEKYYKRLVERREHFLEEERTRRVKEKLRPAKSRIINDYFGLEGTFKKLDID